MSIEYDAKEYIETFYRIKTKQGKLVPFKFNNAQNKLYELIRDNYGVRPGRYIVLKARQMGISTFAEGLITYLTSSQFYTDSTIVAHQSDSAKKIYEMTKTYLDELPDILKPKQKANNARMIVFDDPKGGLGLKSSIRVSVANDSTRGSTYRYVHISELAFWEHPKEAMLSLMQTVPQDDHTIVIIESTANGFNYFYDLWDKAVKGENDFIPVFFPWYMEPSYKRMYSGFKLTKYEKEIKEIYNLTNEQLEWRRWCIANNCDKDENTFRQEYPISPEEAFITSGTSVFNTQLVLSRIKKVKAPMKRGFFVYDYDGLHISNIRWVEDENGYISIYSDPTGDYTVLAGDTAGDGEDYFTGHVLNREGKQMAVLHHQFDEDLYTKQMYCLGMHYRSLIGIEANFSTYPIRELKRLGYPMLYVRETYDKAMEDYQEKYGFKTTALTRPIIISQLVEIVREHIELIVDKATLEEMLSFVKIKGKAQASDGTHDDLVMALAIAYEILKQIPPKEVKVIDTEYDDYDDFYSFGM